MLLSHHRLSLLLGLAATFVGQCPAHAATISTENWATPGDSQGWLFGALGGAGTPTFTGDGVSWVANSNSSGGWLTGFQAQGQPSASGGRFAGDYIAAGVAGLAFDFALDSDSLNNAGPPTLRILFTSVVAGGFNSYWRHDFSVTPTVGGGLQRYIVPMEASSWSQYLGSAPFTEAIRNVQTVEVDYFRLGSYPSYSQTGRFQNFTAVGVPEPTALALAAGCAVALLKSRQT